MLKGSKVKEVLIKVSIVCWTKMPQKTAKAEHNKKGIVDILKIFLESPKLSGASIYPMTDIKTEHGTKGEPD